MPRKHKPKLTIVDLFCGAGGFSSAAIRAVRKLKGELRKFIAINHWDYAVATHSENHKFATHFCEAVDAVDPMKVIPGKNKRIHLLLASPECFPAGTLILTEHGLKPIETVQKGECVLTHTGYWMPVTNVMRSIKDTVVIRGQGHYGLETTSEHPFLSRQRTRYWNNDLRLWKQKFSEDEWTPAEKLLEHYWATPVAADHLDIPDVGGRGVIFNEDFWWMVGRWLGDGIVRIRETSSEITIVCGKDEVAELAAGLRTATPVGLRAGMGEYRWRDREIKTAHLFEMAHDGLAHWLVEHFGKLAHGKTIPAWALTMPIEWRRALLTGYLSADGNFQESRGKHQADTVSKKLAIGIRLLAESLGYRTSLYKLPNNRGEIDGRKINGSDIYSVRWLGNRIRLYTTEDEQHSWSKVREVVPCQQGVTVYNLSVEGDESYIADGIVVHNCTHHSYAAGDRPINDQSRVTAWHVLKWLQEVYTDAFIIENVREFTDWGPITAKGRPVQKLKGQTFLAYISAMKSLGYKVEWKVLNSADYGAATRRERLFIMGRRDGKPIQWPKPTHQNPKKISDKQISLLFQDDALQPWRPARDIIDWSIKGKSVFNRAKPLSPNTMRRIMVGLYRYGLKPFTTAGSGPTGTARPKSVDDPLNTVLADSRVGVLAEPAVIKLYGTGTAVPVDGPMPAVTANGNHLGLMEPMVLGQQSGAAARPVSQPLPTIAGAGAISLIEPFMVNAGGPEVSPRPVSDPMNTILTREHMGLVEPYMVPVNHGQGDLRSYSVDDPLRTQTSWNDMGIAEPWVVPIDHNGGNGGPMSVDRPLGTVMTKARFALAQPEPYLAVFHGASYPGGERVRSVDTPFPTISAGGQQVGLVQPWLVVYNGTSHSADVNDPMPTITGIERLALCVPVLQPNGEYGYLLMDILFRMLEPHELAAAMAFPKGYRFVAPGSKDISKRDKVKMIGNAVEGENALALCYSQLSQMMVQ